MRTLSPGSPAVCRPWAADLQGYGLTETSPVVSTNRLDDIPAYRRQSGVQVSWETRMRCVKADVMLGYWNLPMQPRRCLPQMAGYTDTARFDETDIST
jgi:long-subunit acyl-CoA synthetase (AMP-forming)